MLTSTVLCGELHPRTPAIFAQCKVDHHVINGVHGYDSMNYQWTKCLEKGFVHIKYAYPSRVSTCLRHILWNGENKVLLSGFQQEMYKPGLSNIWTPCNSDKDHFPYPEYGGWSHLAVLRQHLLRNTCADKNPLKDNICRFKPAEKSSFSGCIHVNACICKCATPRDETVLSLGKDPRARGRVMDKENGKWQWSSCFNTQFCIHKMQHVQAYLRLRRHLFRKRSKSAMTSFELNVLSIFKNLG